VALILLTPPCAPRQHHHRRGCGGYGGRGCRRPGSRRAPRGTRHRALRSDLPAPLSDPPEPHG